jgi:hypothetical protein
MTPPATSRPVAPSIISSRLLRGAVRNELLVTLPPDGVKPNGQQCRKSISLTAYSTSANVRPWSITSVAASLRDSSRQRACRRRSGLFSLRLVFHDTPPNPSVRLSGDAQLPLTRPLALRRIRWHGIIPLRQCRPAHPCWLCKVHHSLVVDRTRRRKGKSHEDQPTRCHSKAEESGPR